MAAAVFRVQVWGADCPGFRGGDPSGHFCDRRMQFGAWQVADGLLLPGVAGLAPQKGRVTMRRLGVTA